MPSSSPQPSGRRAFLRSATVGVGAATAVVAAACSRAAGQATQCSEPVSAGGVAPETARSAIATPQTILILGGTGFLGPHVVEVARARGHKVTLFNRGKTRPQLFPDLEKLRGDRNGDLSALGKRPFDIVIDTSGYVPRQVTAASEALGEIGSYVFISSISVYAESPDPIDEDFPVQALTNPDSENIEADYGALKAACERAAQAARPGRSMSIRPGLIVGPGDPTDRFTYWPVRVSRGGEMLAPGSAQDPVQWIDVRDLARLCVLAAEARAIGAINAVASPQPIGELLASCQRCTEADTKFRWADAAVLEAAGVAPWSDMPAWIPQNSSMAGMARVSNERARTLGLEARHIDDTVAATWAWWRLLPEDRRAKLRAGITPEREKVVLASLAGSATG